MTSRSVSEKLAPVNAEMRPIVSVLVCTYNRPLLLQKALTAILAEQSIPADEVVVVNGGGEPTDRVLQPLAKKYPSLKIVKIQNVSLANSQNTGLDHCKGDIIALTDDDAIVDSDWIAMLTQVHQEHPEAAAVGGPVITLFPDRAIARIAHYTTFNEPQEGRYVRTIAGVNVSYKRPAVEEIGKLDESLYSSEEVDYNWRVLKAGYKIWWDPRIRVHHHDRCDLRSYLSQQFDYGRGYFQTRAKWKDLYNAYPGGGRGWKNWAKLGYFVPGIVLDPLLTARKVMGIRDKFVFFPLHVLAGFCHRSGYVYQFLVSRSKA